ncbi:peptide-methionine (S)-S-oxide reductase [Tistlia consotensis]|uniref:Peptide methionine sulfoxide reductase MsrA n=1 Tax=Tistlia consotensis USBA 355 TaxID=560819 RepID=A0A1Y6CNI9_9PROT|nr:peptide-methionine (S)-S-oxide reductase MsrA [Tistlia consotensis]SMF79074.1 peptide-methionine (S)-S-oxide reductase [Tistlia consotensis USBA 355]SNS15749.1 peptide-methionine (S)-S-oxide reductase [Tistlia consotensis]
MEKASFAAGCFWGIEDAFGQVPGVIQTEVGYMGGNWPNPTYHQVCSGVTGHAETVRVIYIPELVGYHDLLDLFWQIHDPTQVNRQGPDRGPQYRSAIFVHDEGQRAAAMASRAAQDASGRHRRRIATIIEPAGDFWRAEEYHQQYFAKRGLASLHA